MTELIRELISYDFLIRAAAVGAAVSLCSSLLGVVLVLKRYSMIGDGLSHVGFGALAVALAMGAQPLYLSIPVISVAAVVLLKITSESGINGDAAIGLLATSGLAVGVTALSAVRGVNADVAGYMFGSVLAMSQSDVLLSAAVSAAVLFRFVVCYNRIFAVTFDEDFAKASGLNTGLYNTMTALLTGLTIAVGMRLMGAMLISGLLIFPALTSMRCFTSFRSVVISAAFVSITSFIIGLLLSYIFSIPAGASIVLANMAFFALFAIIGALR